MSYTNGLDKPSDYFNTKLYTGNGSTQSINGIGFQPDWTWIKSRGDTSNHRIYDGVRGATKVIYSNLSNVEGTDPNGLTSFDSDGFSLGTEGQSNGSGVNFASWNWLASNTTASNTDGSITSTVSANTTSGFSIVSYAGTSSNATVGHGLGVAPSMIIIKNRTSAYEWVVYNKNLNANYNLYLNRTDAAAESDIGDLWLSTAPTSSFFTLAGNKIYANYSGQNYIAYCFAEKKGFSKFGSYTGNGSTDGTFVYTGFKPAMIILKNASDTYNWEIRDNKRRTYNEANENRLFPNLSNAESVNTETIDFLSNGFKIRNAGGGDNGSGNTIIYMAFAENPLVTSTGVPCTAR